MLPLSDGIPARRFPIVNVALIVGQLRASGSSTSSRTSTRRSSTPRSIPARSTAPATARAVGDQLVHRDVPARKLGSHPRQHALPGDLRQERRGRVRPPALPRLLLRRRLRRDDDADRDDAALRHGGGGAGPEAGRERRDRRRARRLLRALPDARVLGRGRRLPGQLPAWFFLGAGSCTSSSRQLRPLRAAANGGGVAFFAHVGGFVFGALVTAKLLNTGRIVPQTAMPRSVLAPL